MLHFYIAMLFDILYDLINVILLVITGVKVTVQLLSSIPAAALLLPVALHHLAARYSITLQLFLSVLLFVVVNCFLSARQVNCGYNGTRPPLRFQFVGGGVTWSIAFMGLLKKLGKKSSMLRCRPYMSVVPH